MDIATIMNKKLDDAVVAGFLKQLPGKVKRERDGLDTRVLCKEAGLEIVAEETICTVFIYPKYSGNVPKGLRFGMSKSDVERILGRPDKVNELGEQLWELGDYTLGVCWAGSKIESFLLSTL